MTTLPPIDRSGLIATRRDLHQHPELGFEERRTSGLVAERLQRLGYTVRTGVGRTGVVGLRDGASGGKARCVLIRADMDALPVEEANDVPYRSQHAGKMHATGHDGDVAIGLAAARRLHARLLPGSGHAASAPGADLQTLASRRRNPFEEGVVSVRQMHAGHAFNVIPGRADLRGTVRTFGGKFYDEAPQLVEETARGIARAFGGDAEVRYRRLSKPLVNDERMTALMKSVAQDIVGRDRVIDGVRTMGGEDMSYFLARVPGAFAFVGSAPPGKKGSPHHSPTFDIDEESLVIGAELVTGTVVRYLEQDI